MRNIDLYDVEDRPWTGPRLRYGAIVGHTTTSSVKIWIRSRYESNCHFILVKDELSENELDIGNEKVDNFIADLGNKVVYQEVYSFKNRTDRSHVFHVRSLNPGTRYFYYLLSDDENLDNRIVLGRQTRYSLKTISSDRNQLNFGLYSCHDPFKKKSDSMPWKLLFEILTEKEADFVIGGGDQVYVDTTKTDIWKLLKSRKKCLWNLSKTELRKSMLSWYQDVYRGYWAMPHIKKVHRSFPNYMIWDDHEIMDGWGSRTRSELSNELDTWYEWEQPEKNLMLADEMFEAAKTVYGQYQHSHNPSTPKDVFDYPLTQKHAEFYFMDMRGQREYDLERLQARDGVGASDRILGKEQLTRFLDWSKSISSSTKVIYIISPVPIIHWTGFAVNSGDVLSTKDDFRDEWDHETNHLERDKILNEVFSVSHTTGVPVVFLSGDVHMSAVFRLSNNQYRAAKVFQVTSSPISRPPAPSITDLILAKEGRLKTLKEHNGYHYKRLAKFNERNFCMFNSKLLEHEELSLEVEFYGESFDEDEIRRKKIKLI